MRFKFRAWDKERLEMFPVKMMDWAEWWVSCDPTHNQARPLKYGERNSFNNERTDRHIIMQYTGMKDKHSKEIYEGDLVKVSEEYGGYAYSPHVVDFKDSCFVLRRVNYMSDYSPMFKYDFTKTYEIIGNIYENPELLSNDQDVSRRKEDEIMAMYLCTCGEWVSSTENHTCKPYPFNVIMTDEDKEKTKKT